MGTAGAGATFGRLVGGRACLDFVNTVGGRDEDGAVLDDRLTSCDALLDWSVLAGVLAPREAARLRRGAAAQPRRAALVLRRAVRLREALYRVLCAVIDEAAPASADLEIVNEEVRRARSRERLVAKPELRWTWERAPGALDPPLWPVAVDAADLLVHGDRARLGRCPGPHCGWLFLDASRSGRRQWCDMATCGNAAKVRRFRERRTGRRVTGAG